MDIGANSVGLGPPGGYEVSLKLPMQLTTLLTKSVDWKHIIQRIQIMCFKIFKLT